MTEVTTLDEQSSENVVTNIGGNPEKILHQALCQIMSDLNMNRHNPDESVRLLERINTTVQKVLCDYADAVMPARYPVRWNCPDAGKTPKLTTDGLDHHAVTRVSYEEVSNLLGTSGCSKEEPYWIHSVMGAIRSDRGIQLVCPGDWIVTPLPGLYQVFPNDQFTKLYLE